MAHMSPDHDVHAQAHVVCSSLEPHESLLPAKATGPFARVPGPVRAQVYHLARISHRAPSRGVGDARGCKARDRSGAEA